MTQPHVFSQRNKAEKTQSLEKAGLKVLIKMRASKEGMVINMNIVVLDGYTENPGDLSWSGFEKLGELTVYDRTPADKIIERIGNSEIVITNKTPITAEALEKCPNVTYIGVLATGYNIVDTVAAKKRGIPVCNIPTYGTNAVAQHTFALILEACNHIGEHSRSVKNGDWTDCADFCYWN